MTAPASSIRWAVLLARIYEVLPLLCPSCGGQMSILAFPDLEFDQSPTPAFDD